MEQHETRKVYYFLLLATVVLAGVYVFNTYFRTKNVEAPVLPHLADTQAIQVGLVNPLYVKNQKIIQDNKYTTIDIEYPEFTNIDARENRKIIDFYTKFIAEHTIISKENLQARFETDSQNTGKPFSTQTILEEEKFPAYGGYSLSQVNDDFISVLFSYGAFQGGAHGFQDLMTFNYDVKNKKILSLADILKDTKIEQTNVLEFLSEESRKQLLKKFAPEVEYKKSVDDLVYDADTYGFIIGSIYVGTEPIPENFTIYTFTPDALTIYFGQYQVASYADGIQEVVIPLK